MRIEYRECDLCGRNSYKEWCSNVKDEWAVVAAGDEWTDVCPYCLDRIEKAVGLLGELVLEVKGWRRERL